jgi:hypothetical protein
MARRLTREILDAHLHCRYKGHLKRAGEQAAPSDHQVLAAELRVDVRQRALDRIATHEPAAAVVRDAPLTAAVLRAGPAFVLDAVLEDDGFSLRFDGLKRVDGPSKLGDYHYVPMLFHGGGAIRDRTAAVQPNAQAFEALAKNEPTVAKFIAEASGQK